MVGVKSANKCHTCRRKKIKCDEQRPSCGPCKKGARICEGFARPATFLNKTSTDYDTSASRVQKHQARAPAGLRISFPKTAMPCASPGHKASVPGLAPPLRFQTWSHEQLLADFVDNCLPVSTSQDMPLSWLRALMPMHKEIDALPLAISALAFGWAGHVDDYPDLVDKGLQLYNAAVHQLRTEMTERSPHQVLATTTLFAMYELFEFGSESSRGWLCHVSGIAGTLRMLGPERVSQPPYDQLFSFCRMLFLVKGLRQSRPICAGAPMWKGTPFQHSQKTAFQQLVDLGLETADVLAQISALDGVISPNLSPRSHAWPSLQKVQLSQVMQATAHHIEKLRLWEFKTEIYMVNGPYEDCGDDPITPEESAKRSRLRGYPSKPTGDTQLTFDGLQAVRAMHLYWTLMLKIYLAIFNSPTLHSELQSRGSQSPSSESTTPSSSATDSKGMRSSVLDMTMESVASEAHQMANKIAYYGKFCCQNLWQSYGPMVSILSLETAIEWYESRHCHVARDLSPFTSSGSSGVHLTRCRELLAAIRAGSETSLFHEYQNMAFGHIDVLSLLWC